MDYGTRQLNVTEVTRAITCPRATSSTPQTRVNYAKAGVHESSLYGITIFIVGVSGDNFRHRNFAYLLWRHQAEIHAVD